jgi:hypothetical protein
MLTFPRIIHKRGGLHKRCESEAEWAVDQADGWVINLADVWGLPAEEPLPVAEKPKAGRKTKPAE